MKKIICTTMLFIGLTTTAFAQLKEAKVSFDMKFASDNPEMQMGISMMEGSKMSLEFMPGKSKSVVSMGMMGTMTTITDMKEKKALSLMDMMGMKYAMESDLDKKDEEASEPEIQTTSETKKILGYNCTKVIVTQDGQTVDMWVTKEIDAFLGGQNYFNEKAPGFPLEFVVNNEEMSVSMTATEVKKGADKKAFSLKVPEGYEVKTEEEMMMMGQ